MPRRQRRLRRDFDALHERTYGYASPEAPVETVHLAITLSAPARVAVESRDEDAPARPATGGAPEPAGHRDAFVGTAERASVPVHHWAGLAPGQIFDGPALVDGPDTTAYVAPGFTCRVGPLRVLHITAEPA